MSNCCNECDEVVTCGGCNGIKTSCKCNIYEGDTLANTGITAGDTACTAYSKIDETILELNTKIDECCADSGLLEVGRGAAVPTDEPADSDPHIYVRNNGEVYTWNGTEWVLQIQVTEVEKGTGAHSSTPADNEQFIYINQLGTVWFWDKSNQKWVQNTNPIYTDSGIQGVGSNTNPIRENFDNLPSNSSITVDDYVIVSTAANPDGAKIKVSDFTGDSQGVTIEAVDGTVEEATTKGLFLEVTPDGSQASSFTIKPKAVNNVKEVIANLGTGISNISSNATTRLHWDNKVELDGYLNLTNNSNILATNDILLTTLPVKYRPTVEKRFPAVLIIFMPAAGAEPECSYNGYIQVLTNGQVRLLVTECKFLEDVETLTTGGGFDGGYIWLSSIQYFVD